MIAMCMRFAHNMPLAIVALVCLEFFVCFASGMLQKILLIREFNTLCVNTDSGYFCS